MLLNISRTFPKDNGEENNKNSIYLYFLFVKSVSVYGNALGWWLADVRLSPLTTASHQTGHDHPVKTGSNTIILR